MWGLSLMLIEAGYEIAFECPAQTPMLLELNVHPSRDADLLTPDSINYDPPLATRSYIDHFGNRVTRVEAPAGLVTFSNRFVIHDSGEPDETPPGTEMTPIAGLADDMLLFLVSSRYCDSDNLADFAWARFGTISGLSAGGGDLRFRSRENRVQLSRRKPNPLRQRFHARGSRRLPRLRPSRHRALPVHEHSRALLHRLSRRHRRSDINPMDFSAWAEVFLDGRWYTIDARHNHPRIGRIVMGRGRDAADVAMSTAFGVANLARFEVVTQEQVQRGNQAAHGRTA
jgi:transglutaminase-like putative cysteine protease